METERGESGLPNANSGTINYGWVYDLILKKTENIVDNFNKILSSTKKLKKVKI